MKFGGTIRVSWWNSGHVNYTFLVSNQSGEGFDSLVVQIPISPYKAYKAIKGKNNKYFEQYIGKYWDENNPDHVKRGKKHHLVFRLNNCGPFWMSEKEQNERKYFIDTGKTKQKN